MSSYDPLRRQVEVHHVIEREGWRVDRARRVTEQLQAALPEDARFETLVIHSDQTNAFTGPGRTIYITHRLLDQLPDEAAAAFVIAHEIAHHHLGHVPGRFARTWPMFEPPPVSHERERHADLHAIELCMGAGYAPDRCIIALQILDALFLSCGDLEASMGAPHDPDGDIARRGYFPSRDRIAHVQAHVAAYRSGARIVNLLAAQRAAVDRRRITSVMATIGSLAATAVLVLLRRR